MSAPDEVPIYQLANTVRLVFFEELGRGAGEGYNKLVLMWEDFSVAYWMQISFILSYGYVLQRLNLYMLARTLNNFLKF